MSKSLNEINEMFNMAFFMPTTPETKRVPEGHIFDEEQSVRWNREEVMRNNARYWDEIAKLKEAQKVAINAATEALREYIKDTSRTGFTDGQVSIIYNYLYSRYHHCWSDFMASVDETIDMFDDFAQCGKK